MLETERSKTGKRKFREELKDARKELAIRAERETQLAVKAHRCQALIRDIELEMNAFTTKYKDQIGVLKDEIDRAKIGLQRSYERPHRKR
ncbi:hypothetical protein ACOSQ4_013569 [Xanthoceras sorbifolium]